MDAGFAKKFVPHAWEWSDRGVGVGVGVALGWGWGEEWGIHGLRSGRVGVKSKTQVSSSSINARQRAVRSSIAVRVVRPHAVELARVRD